MSLTVPILIIVVLLALAFFIALKIVKNVIKAIFSVLGIASLLLGIVAVILVADAQKFQSSFEGDKTILFEKEGVIEAGIQLTGEQTNEEIDPNTIDTLTEEELQALNEIYAINETIESTEEELIIIIPYESLKPEEEIEVFGTETKTPQEFEELLESETHEELIEGLIEDELTVNEKEQLKQQIKSEYGEPKRIQTLLYMQLLSEKMQNQGTKFLIENIIYKEIKIYPQFLVLDIIDYLPTTIKDKLINKSVPEE